MPDHYIWGLQALRERIPTTKQADFAQLEAQFLDLIHRQRLYNDPPELANEKATLIQQLNIFALANTNTRFADLCHPPTINTSVATLPVPHHQQQSSPIQQFDSSLVSVDVLVRTIPTAYYNYYIKDKFLPVLKIRIHNPHNYSLTAHISLQILDYGIEYKKKITIQPYKQWSDTFSVLLQVGKIRTITARHSAFLSWTIKYAEEIYHNNEIVKLLPYNTALLQIFEPPHDYRNYLASWVTPNDPDLPKVIHLAYQRHPTSMLNTTNIPLALFIRTQVQALFDTLAHDLSIHYIHSASSFQQEDSQWFIQRVQFPKEVIRHKLANCIDGSILFASLLERLGIEPLIILIPGHAFVGWYIDREQGIKEFLETTELQSATFEDAMAKPHTYTNALQRAFSSDPPKDILGHDKYVNIDIAQCRKQGITPIEA